MNYHQTRILILPTQKPCCSLATADLKPLPALAFSHKLGPPKLLLMRTHPSHGTSTNPIAAERHAQPPPTMNTIKFLSFTTNLIVRSDV